MKLKSLLMCIVITFIANSFISCDNYHDRKAEKKNAKIRANVEKCLSNRDFEQARAEAALLPILRYNEFYPNLYDGGQQAVLRKINRSQMSFLFDSGSYLDALSLAKELDCQVEFLKLLQNNVSEMITDGQSALLFSILSTWSFSSSFHEQYTGMSSFSKADAERNPDHELREPLNINYNIEVESYNNIVNSLFTNALFCEDVPSMKQCLKLYKPMAEQKRQEDSWEWHFFKSYKMRDEAKQKAYEAGFNL